MRVSVHKLDPLQKEYSKKEENVAMKMMDTNSRSCTASENNLVDLSCQRPPGSVDSSDGTLWMSCDFILIHALFVDILFVCFVLYRRI